MYIYIDIEIHIYSVCVCISRAICRVRANICHHSSPHRLRCARSDDDDDDDGLKPLPLGVIYTERRTSVLCTTYIGRTTTVVIDVIDVAYYTLAQIYFITDNYVLFFKDKTIYKLYY